MRITVYSKPQCVQCTATERTLRSVGADFTVVDLTEQPAALEYVTEDLGYSQAPVVVVEDGTGQHHWSGYNRDRLKAAAAA